MYNGIYYRCNTDYEKYMFIHMHKQSSVIDKNKLKASKSVCEQQVYKE